jgi:hypothetical protein
MSVNGTTKARAIAQEAQHSVDSKGTDIRGAAIAMVDGFQVWFSQRKWNVSGNEGRLVFQNSAETRSPSMKQPRRRP